MRSKDYILKIIFVDSRAQTKFILKVKTNIKFFRSLIEAFNEVSSFALQPI